MSTSIKLSEMTAEEKQSLKAELAQEEKDTKAKIKEDKTALKEIGVEFLEKNIDILVNRQQDIETLVDNLFAEFGDILTLKSQVYGVDILDQDSHTITNSDGTASIKIGQNVNITFDGTEAAGVQKIMNYLTALSGDTEDEKAQKLAKAVKFFLKPNFKTGMLNPGRIIQLNQMRSDFNSPEFDDAMDIIVNAQIRQKGSSYVSGYKFIKVGDVPSKKVEFRFTV